MTSDNKAFSGADVWLRPFAKEHLKATYNWLQDQDLRRDFMLTRQITREGHAKWFQRLAGDDTQGVFAIETRAWGHVGNTGVKNLEGRKGELWIYLKPGKVRGKGLGLLATRELIRILFEEMNLDTVYLHVAETNKAALGLYEKLGFVRSKQSPSAEWNGYKAPMIRMHLTRAKAGNEKKILLACYDSGGANALAVLARELDRTGHRVLVLAAGPSKSVFRNQRVQIWKELDRDITLLEAERILDQSGCGLVILGTSLKARAERNLCRAAREKGIPTLAFVDFWSNYGRRFSTPGTIDLAYVPDKVAVLDEFSGSACEKQGIPQERIIITGNPYWDYLVSLKQADKGRIRKRVRAKLGLDPNDRVVLIISSNLRNLEFDLGYTDQDLFEAIFPVPDRRKGKGRVCFLVKPHPEEPRAELLDLVKGRGLVLEPDAAPLDTVLASDLVIGSVSSLIFEAALLGLWVISLQPVGLSGQKQTLRLFTRMGIPEIGSPWEAEKHVLDFLENPSSNPAKPGPTMAACSGRALEKFFRGLKDLETTSRTQEARE